MARLVLKRVRKKRGADLKRIALRENFWPDVEDEDLWIRTQRTGFTTVPRTMSLIGRVMDQMSGKGFPLFSTYFSLWCRVFDEAFVEVRNEREFAFESGFNGPRGEVTWRSRMRRLHELGFIDVKPGLASDLQYVLIWNPIKVIANAYERPGSPMNDLAYHALKARLIEVGADDLDSAPDDGDDDDEDDEDDDE